MNSTWKKIGSTNDFPTDMGSCVKVSDQQIAVFRIATSSEEQWYAVQNMNPFNQRTVLSRGLVGCLDGTPKVACPLHKQNFSLIDGRYLGEEDVSLETYPVKVEGNEVFLSIA